MLAACTSYDKTQLIEIVDLPAKTTRSYDTNWQNTPLRAHSNFIFYGANTQKERRDRLGDYYFVSLYDNNPDLNLTIHMYYTQSASGSEILSRTQEIAAPREGKGRRKLEFFFAGKDRAQRGDILSWKMDIYAGDELMDSKQSYLWQ